MDYALPAGAPLAARRWLRSLLLMPPEPHVAMSLHRACRELWRDHGSLPTFVAMSPANVVLKLKKREGNADFFNELKDLCSVVGAACDSPALADMCDNVLVAVASETGVRLAAHELAVKLAEVRELVEDVVEPAVKPPSSANIPPEFADIADVLTRMKLSNEEYKGKVKDATIPLAVDQVENAWRRIMVEAHACVSLAKQAAAFSSSSGKDPSAGMARPQAPKRAHAHVERSMVDLPAMFGPVTRNMPFMSNEFRTTRGSMPPGPPSQYGQAALRFSELFEMPSFLELNPTRLGNSQDRRLDSRT